MNPLKARAVYFAVAIAVALGMINARSVSAQEASQATIPFAFSANQQVFPAGHYRVVRESDNYLSVVSTETGIVADLMVHTSRTLQQPGKNSLLFLHDDRGYHLLTVRFAQGGAGVQTEMAVQPKPERELAKASTPTEIGMN
jgi:hypothetical protein